MSTIADRPGLLALTSPWVLRDGCVYTTQTLALRCASGKTLQVPVSVAFNVGDTVGQHMVDMHNAALLRP